MLPCMDEPRFKAAFRVSLDVPAAAVALSNGAVRARAPYVAAQAAATYGEAAAAAGEGSRFEGLEYETVAFSATPPMATYLLAIAVGELVGTTVQVPSAPLGEAGGEVNVTVWCVPMGDAAERAARVEALSTARDTAAAILPAYAGLFGQPFPLAKLDLLALPKGKVVLERVDPLSEAEPVPRAAAATALSRPLRRGSTSRPNWLCIFGS